MSNEENKNGGEFDPDATESAFKAAKKLRERKLPTDVKAAIDWVLDGPGPYEGYFVWSCSTCENPSDPCPHCKFNPYF